MTVTTFSELELDENLLEALQDKGFTRPTAIQAAAIPPALDGRDILGSAPTGTGKTAAYLLPASVSYTHLRAHETRHDLVCRLLLEKKKLIVYS